MVGMPRSIKGLTFKTRREGFLEDDDIELSSIEQPLGPVDRERLKAHVAKLAVEGFFEDAPDEQIDSLKTALELGVFAASMHGDPSFNRKLSVAGFTKSGSRSMLLFPAPLNGMLPSSAVSSWMQLYVTATSLND